MKALTVAEIAILQAKIEELEAERYAAQNAMSSIMHARGKLHKHIDSLNRELKSKDDQLIKMSCSLKMSQFDYMGAMSDCKQLETDIDTANAMADSTKAELLKLLAAVRVYLSKAGHSAQCYNQGDKGTYTTAISCICGHDTVADLILNI